MRSKNYVEQSDGSTCLSIESQAGATYYYPTVNSFHDLRVGQTNHSFFRLPRVQKTELLNHNIENYVPSKEVSQMTESSNKPSVDALELMADEIVKVTEYSSAYMKKQ
ncbi:hypothetical protein ACNVED_07625 [Legionella sp. D16C41]|uniref:hypothetical protein n=1 Tax=Legionella sp. D16C41 TaxID=3402688 RepID=UPI003AF8B405